MDYGDAVPDDVIDHEHGPDCVCGPVAIPVVAGDGPHGTITGHHPLVGDLPLGADEGSPVSEQAPPHPRRRGADQPGPGR